MHYPGPSTSSILSSWHTLCTSAPHCAPLNTLCAPRSLNTSSHNKLQILGWARKLFAKCLLTHTWHTHLYNKGHLYLSTQAHAVCALSIVSLHWAHIQHFKFTAYSSQTDRPKCQILHTQQLQCAHSARLAHTRNITRKQCHATSINSPPAHTHTQFCLLNTGSR